MATGSSTAELALIPRTQEGGARSRPCRHALIAWLLGIRRMIVAVNKMDLVDFRECIFNSIRDDFAKCAVAFPGMGLHLLPLSALSGENVIDSNGCMPWYRGPSLLQLLEQLPTNALLSRFPVQSVIRPNQDFRGYAGRVGSGTVKVGDEVLALPSGHRATVDGIFLYKQKLEKAVASQSIVLTLSKHIDLGRGDMLVTRHNPPTVTARITCNLDQTLFCSPWKKACVT